MDSNNYYWFYYRFKICLNILHKKQKIGSSDNTTTYFTDNSQNDYPFLNDKIYENKNVSKNSQEISNTIKTFIEYCNNRQVEEAYDMLSEDTKYNLYKSKTEFVKNYYITFLKQKNI